MLRPTDWREPMLPAKQSAPPPQLIRLGMMAGVLLFGAVSLFVHRQPGWRAATLPPAVDYALLAISVIALSVAVPMRRRVLREPDPQRRVSLLITGWAVGQAAGLVGTVIFYVTGQGQWYLLGLLAMAGSFAVLRTKDAT